MFEYSYTDVLPFKAAIQSGYCGCERNALTEKYNLFNWNIDRQFSEKTASNSRSHCGEKTKQKKLHFNLIENCVKPKYCNKLATENVKKHFKFH